MQNIIEEKLLNKMKSIINRFTQTPDGYCCLESDRLGMYNFIIKKESGPMSPEWQKAFDDVAVEILFVKTSVEFDYPEMAKAA